MKWVRFPNNATLKRYYPAGARARNQEGNVIIACDWNDSGHIIGCQVIEETPRGFGFGAASGQMLIEVGQLGPKDEGAVMTGGKGMPVILRWRLD